MSDKIAQSFRPAKSSAHSDHLNTDNLELQPLSDAQMNTLVQDMSGDKFDDIDKLLQTIDTENISPIQMNGINKNLNVTNVMSGNMPMMQFPIPNIVNCSNITINYNLKM